MRRAILAVVVAAAGCGSEDSCDKPGAVYDLTPPAAEPGAACVPSRWPGAPNGDQCIGHDGTMRPCWFDCAGTAAAASGCTPGDGCTGEAAQTCLFRCPMADPPCVAASP
jgi:hypothetical protein